MATQRDPDGSLSRSVFDLLSLERRTIVITGGARSIGLALAFACAEAGASVAILDLPDEAHPHFHELPTCFPKQQFELYKTDVTSYETLQDTLARVVGDFGSIDGIITAAGICPDEPFLEPKPESVARCMSINVLGTYYAAQLAAAQVGKQEPKAYNSGRGSMVFIASISAYVVSKGQNTSDYCASKDEVLSLAKTLGVELASKGIRVNSILPGCTMTEMPLDLCDRMHHLGHIMTTEPLMGRGRSYRPQGRSRLLFV